MVNYTFPYQKAKELLNTYGVEKANTVNWLIAKDKVTDKSLPFFKINGYAPQNNIHYYLKVESEINRIKLHYNASR